ESLRVLVQPSQLGVVDIAGQDNAWSCLRRREDFFRVRFGPAANDVSIALARKTGRFESLDRARLVFAWADTSHGHKVFFRNAAHRPLIAERNAFAERNMDHAE